MGGSKLAEEDASLEAKHKFIKEERKRKEKRQPQAAAANVNVRRVLLHYLIGMSFTFDLGRPILVIVVSNTFVVNGKPEFFLLHQPSFVFALMVYSCSACCRAAHIVVLNAESNAPPVMEKALEFRRNHFYGAHLKRSAAMLPSR